MTVLHSSQFESSWVQLAYSYRRLAGRPLTRPNERVAFLAHIIE